MTKEISDRNGKYRKRFEMKASGPLRELVNRRIYRVGRMHSDYINFYARVE